MNCKFTFTFIIMACMTMSMSAQVIWGGPGDPNGEFDGGLNDWTTQGLYSNVPDSAANAVWVWSSDGIPQGSLSGENPIASESVGNGAVIFDSDFLDNGGNLAVNEDGSVTNFDMTGSGSAPAFTSGTLDGTGQGGILTSPTIDCSGEPSVNLRFFSYFRSFRGEMSVDISGDNGATWDTIAVNTDDDLDVTPDNVVLIDISEFAANTAEVKIQFRWDSAYYFWMVDDVSLISLPGNNLSISKTGTFYSPASAVQPACALDEDLISFSTDVSNIGGDTVRNIVYKATVTINETGEEIYMDSMIIESLEIGYVDSSFTIEELWDPEILEEGIYRITHQVYSLDNPDDFDPSNNIVYQFFEVDDFSFSKEIGGPENSGLWDDGDFFAIGALYTLGSNCMEQYTISTVDYAAGVTGSDPNPFVGRNVEFWLWKMKSLNIGDFDFLANYEESINTISHPSMDFVAFSIDKIDEEDAAADIISSDAPFLNADAEEVTPILEPGSKYGLFVHWGIGGTTGPLHLITEENDANDMLLYFKSDGRFYTGYSNFDFAPILRMQLALYSSVDDLALSDDAFKVYPNPATDLLNLELNLENSSNATITIADITGKVISYQTLNNAQRDVVTLNVSTYVSGTYLARVATKKGTKTVKFIVD